MNNYSNSIYPPFDQSFEIAYRFPVYFTEGIFSEGNPLLRDLIIEQNELMVI
jgi:hypothetical protein